MILDKTRRNRRSRFTAETRIPVGKVRPRKASRAGEPATVPAIRWSVTSGGGHGSGARQVSRPDMQRRLEDQAANRRRCRCGTRGRLGVQPELFSSVLVLPRADPVPPLSSPGSGGDEETRTPDPLLAKEMLCQLSYVPIATRGWWWAFLDSNQRPLPYQGSALTS